MPMPRKYTDEQLIRAVAASTTVSELMRYLKVNAGGGSRWSVQRRIEQLNIDISHFKGQGWNRGHKKRADEVIETLLTAMKQRKKITGLRDRLFDTGLKERKCERCGITRWQGEPAPLQVDHINGDRLNNDLKNLRILCANCHMLTPTWGFKKRS